LLAEINTTKSGVLSLDSTTTKMANAALFFMIKMDNQKAHTLKNKHLKRLFQNHFLCLKNLLFFILNTIYCVHIFKKHHI
jgi:hypothetical protein